jgi:fructose-1,6-bisphosphatase/inositol monophosphatase family enzyme
MAQVYATQARLFGWRVGGTALVFGVVAPPGNQTDRTPKVFSGVFSKDGMIRCCNSALHSLIEVAAGVSNSFVSLDTSTWEIMGAMAILRVLPVADRITWSGVDLTKSWTFRWAGGIH